MHKKIKLKLHVWINFYASCLRQNGKSAFEAFEINNAYPSHTYTNVYKY